MFEEFWAMYPRKEAKKDAFKAWMKLKEREKLLALAAIPNHVKNWELKETEKNLSFEREFGKMIGRTDLYAISLAEKSQRFISRVMQNLATAVFLPI